ncbi:cobalt-precorrin-4/precorrin-4 C(11)-methyltransferase [Umezawaea sp. Da 62-37]|uniref:cobalt-precorrin-4/precorrin-4 C(11)-methyltransferase n=1 Tax=Umezawaea sp. Da 62-37 TaxID=3075927 RepID=UPI0028F6D243|nr:cobalt-precorrin-4/precorrin-4 C(11)-methyltransferase [Umezawaea sp. Da 62-37]WNV89813.1 cobalt-precorrin-4/precorrin-4 C(11)-methyltransferase [Umezawaea sp. Da 62-37]
MSGRISFVGAGPGAADLITLRGAKRIAEADVVVWAPSAIDVECVREHARPEAELIDFSRVSHEEVIEVYRRAAAGRLKVVRLHAGDPSLWSDVQDQYDTCARLGLDLEIVPGVSQFSAAAAAIGRELTTSEVAQSLILTGPEGSEHLQEFAGHGTTMAISLSAARTGQLVEKLRAGGYPEDTPIVVAYKVSWPDETIAHTTLAGLEASVKEHKLYRTTMFLVGKVLKPSSRVRGTGFRKSDAPVEASDEPVRKARPSKWSVRAGRHGRISARTDLAPEITDVAVEPAPETETSVAAWSAVRDWQESARRPRVVTVDAGEAPEASAEPVLSAVSEPGSVSESGSESAGDPVEGPKPRAVAAATPSRTVQVSTTPRRPSMPRTKKTKRAH